MMRTHGNDPLDQILNGFHNMSMGLRTIAQNPALPEMVRSEFNTLADAAMVVIGPVHTLRYDAVMNGVGPRSNGLRDAAGWLKLPVEGINFSRLAPKASFEWQTQVENADDHEMFMRSWSQFFYTQYPLEFFSDEDATIKVKYVLDGYTFEITAYAQLTTLEPGDLPPERVWIKEVQVSYWPKEEFWRGFVTITRGGALFREKPCSDVHITHNVEGVMFTAELKGIVPFMIDHVISHLVGRLGFCFKDYSLAGEPGFRDNLKGFMEDIASGYPEHHVIAAKNHIVRACSNSGHSKGLVIDVPDVGEVNIILGNTDWWDFEKYEAKIKEYSWHRDMPLFKINYIKVAGVDVSGRRLPTAWNHRISEAIFEAMQKVCTDATYWPKSPEQLAAEKAAKEQD
jgi:hypothetical protein